MKRIFAPWMLALALPLAAQQDNLLSALLDVGTQARGRGAAVIWLASPSQALRDRSIRPTHRLRLSDAGLTPVRLTVRTA